MIFGGRHLYLMDVKRASLRSNDEASNLYGGYMLHDGKMLSFSFVKYTSE